MKRLWVTLCAGLLAVLQLSALTLKPPTRSPVCPAGEQARLLQDGILLYDGGSYDEAIKKYDAAIQSNPDCPSAYYERAMAYLKKDYLPGALKDLEAASEYQWEGLAGVYDMMAQVLEAQGDQKGAIAVYETAIAVYPEKQIVLFNAAVTYEGAGETDKALTCAEKAVLLDPNHAGSHFVLGKLWSRQGSRVEAIMALGRFLQLEPKGSRAQEALKLLAANLESGYNVTDDGRMVHVGPSLPSPKADDPYQGVSRALAALRMRRGLPGPGLTEMQAYLYDFQSLSGLLGDIRFASPPFSARFYAPYYVDLGKDGQLEAFCHVIFQSSGLPGIKEWQAANGKKLLAFAQWARSYDWPKKLG